VNFVGEKIIVKDAMGKVIKPKQTVEVIEKERKDDDNERSRIYESSDWKGTVARLEKVTGIITVMVKFGKTTIGCYPENLQVLFQ
jgi:hypothetical protein